jgi:hypothetical protein
MTAMHPGNVNYATAKPCSALALFGLSWMCDTDRATVRRIFPVEDAIDLDYRWTPEDIADALRAVAVERAFGRLSDKGFRALVVVLADLLSPVEGSDA